jgi:RimJ/RimL family protein N-acetyltransferase
LIIFPVTEMAPLSENIDNVKKYFLKSSRLGFRLWREEDLSIAVELWGDYEVTKFFDARGQWTRNEVRERLAAEIKTEKRFGVQYWPISLLETHDPVGCCGLRPYEMSKGIYEIGFHIRSARRRRGYAREAADAVINHAFNVLGANALFAGHNPQNVVSQHLIEQLGFRYTHAEYYPPTGLYHPSYLLKAPEL